jgi:putative endopeptidase
MSEISKILALTCAVVATPLFALENNDDRLNLNWRNTSIAPGENFYTYANANWQKTNAIPPEYPSWGIFNILNEQVAERIHDILINTAKNKTMKPGSIEQKVGDFYFSGMNESAINQQGLTPLRVEFERINAINSLADLQEAIVHFQKIGVDALFSFGSMQDFKDSTLMIGAAMQAGIGLPDRDYYLKDTPKFKKIREAYIAHITKMLILSGDTEQQAKADGAAVMAIETMLAKASMSNTEKRDPNAIYHLMNLQQLSELTPHFSWSNYLKARGLRDIKQLNMGMPNFFKNVDLQLEKINIKDWKAYLRWQLLDAFAPYLAKPFVDQNFKMVQVITGIEKLLPRWKRVVSTENGALGFAIGKMYVDKYFPPEAKQQVLNIIENIRKTLAKDILTLPWMAKSTRQAALTKLDLMKQRVGYPNSWWDYSNFQVDRGPYVLNVLRANQFLVQRDLNKIGKPVDKNEWAMTPQTINAYYDPSMNNINLPAGILQPPLFDPKAPVAANYGAIGFVIGHEITHGFDDQGAKFDGNGNLKNWWTTEDAQQFKKATQCIVDQFKQYKVDDLSVNGELVLGEATADLGGLTLALKAFQESKDYKKAKAVNGLTPDQQFFLSAAHVWALNIRPEQARNLILTDPHPPGLYRVNGTLANMSAFQQAFDIKTPSIMINPKPCVVW